MQSPQFSSFWHRLKSILEPLGIDTIVENPNVGENLQDHDGFEVRWRAAEGATTFDSLTVAGVAEADVVDFYANYNGILTALLNGNANLSYQQIDQRTGLVSPEALANSIQAALIDAIPSLKEQRTCIPPRLQPRYQIHRRRILS